MTRAELEAMAEKDFLDTYGYAYDHTSIQHTQLKFRFVSGFLAGRDACVDTFCRNPDYASILKAMEVLGEETK